MTSTNYISLEREFTGESDSFQISTKILRFLDFMNDFLEIVKSRPLLKFEKIQTLKI